VTSDRTGDHLIPLPGTEWSAWRDVLVRSAGFPAAGLDRFSAPDCAAVADAVLDGRAANADLAAAYADTTDLATKALADIAGDALFREAVLWQNPSLRHYLDAVGSAPVPGEGQAGGGNSRARQRKRVREDTLVRYWQRYCGKNDTIGFFGPVTWARLRADGPAVQLRCGDQLVRSRRTDYEFWVLDTYVELLAADPVVRPWLPVGRHADHTLSGRLLLRPSQEPVELTAAEADLVARADGRTPAIRLAGGAEGLPALESLAARDALWWGVDMPYNPRAEQVLRATLAAIPDPAARARAEAGLARLDTARDEVSAAAGDAGRLADALARLEAEFTALTGQASERRSGTMYAGRRLCFEDTVRDLDVTFGGPLLEALAEPLGQVLLPAARWLSGAVATAFDRAFAELYTSLSPAGGTVPFSQFWDAAQGLFKGAGPVDAVADELTQRWRALFGLDQAEPGTPRVTVEPAEAAGRAAELFPRCRPGWRAARIHSPDLHICASSAEAMNRGEFFAVLGELHAGWPTLDCALFTDRHPDPASLVAAAAEDIGPQFRPLYPTWWPRYTARIAPVLGETDYQLAFAHAPGGDPARLVPVTSLSVTDRNGVLTAVHVDGRSWPVFDVFGLLVAWAGIEALKRVSAGPHTPRITVGKLVVTRETWRTTVGASGLTVAGRLPEYLAARRLRRELGLPEKVFASIGTEVKPVYVDWTSPRYVSSLCTMLRGNDDDVAIAFSELLPSPDEAWLPDASGRSYFSELRIQFVDPLQARKAGDGDGRGKG
jgi:hypothetical protein